MSRRPGVTDLLDRDALSIGDKSMEYRSLGRTGVKVSPLCLGCWMFGDRASKEESVAILNTCVRRRDQLPRHLERLRRCSRTERIDHRRRRQGERQPRHPRHRDQGVLPVDPDDPNGRGISRRGHHRGVREEPSPPPDRLHRPVLHAPPRPRRAGGRAVAGPRRPDSCRQGALHRHQHHGSLAVRRVAVGFEGTRPEPFHRRDAALQHAGPAHRAGAHPDGPDLRGGGQPVGAGRQRHPERPVPAGRGGPRGLTPGRAETCRP